MTAETDRPSNDRATMDGYAFAAADEGPLEIVEQRVFPETEPPTIEVGQAIEIATGAPLPGGADTVCKREDATVDDGRLARPELEAGAQVDVIPTTVFE